MTLATAGMARATSFYETLGFVRRCRDAAKARAPLGAPPCSPPTGTLSSAQDIVHVLGDVATGRRAESMPLIAQLAGRKILYRVNHDRCWDGHGQRDLRLVQE